MRPLDKPNLSIATAWIQSNDALPAEVERLLTSQMPTKTNAEKRRAFLDKVGHTVGLLGLAGTTTASDMIEQLEKVANASRSLLQAISLLNDDTARCLEAHALACAVMRTDGLPQLPERIATQRIASMEGIRSQAWDGAQALETASRFAQSQVQPQAYVKDSKVRAKELVRQVGDAYAEVFGKRPPKSQGLWFADFCAVLGRHVGLECGPRVVSGALTPERGDSAQ